MANKTFPTDMALVTVEGNDKILISETSDGSKPKTVTVDGISDYSFGSKDTDDLAEGSTNKYLSSTQKTDLTDGGDSALHFHSTDRARANHTGTQSADTITDGTTNKAYTATEKTKLAGIEAGAEVNNISDVNATDLTDGGATTLHTHDGRYYTETELNNGQLDNRYFTETEINANFVPYTGANADINLGEHKITATMISLDNTPTTGTLASGDIYWNVTEETADIVQTNGVTLQIGQETQYNIKGDELTGIANGKVVMFTGSDGNSGNLKGALAISDGTYSPKVLMGVATQNITIGNNGKVTRFGKVRGIQTDGANYSETWNDGDLLYVNPLIPGGFTNVMPTAPAWKNSVAVVINAHSSNGTIFVRAENIPELGELNDVDTTGETTGDLIIRNGTHRINTPVFKDTKTLTGFVDNGNVTITGDSAQRKVTLTHSTAVVYYWRGQRVSLGTSWTSSSHGTDTTKVYFLYSTDGATFTWSETPWAFDYIQVSRAFYDSTLGVWLYEREIHGTYDYEAHNVDHFNIGTFRLSGGIPTAGTYALNTSTDLAITPGFDQALIYDEDLPTVIGARPQMVVYTSVRINTSNIAEFNTEEYLPFRYTKFGFINWNNAGVETQGATGKFYNVYQILVPMANDTNSQKFRTIFLQPQAEYSTLTGAQAEDFRSLNLGNLSNFSPEFVAFTRLTYGTSASYGTTGKVQLNGITYLTGSRASQVTVAGFTPTSHNSLSNLTWTSSGHTGTASKIIGFNGSGVATEVTLSGLTFDGTTLSATGAGLAWGATIAGTSGTGITSTISNSASASTVGYSGIIENTQTSAQTLINLNTGTSLFAHKGLYVTAINTEANGLCGAIVANAFSSVTQAIKNTNTIELGWQYNTNSSFSATHINIDNRDNTGTGYNTGIFINNRSTEIDLSTNYGIGSAIRGYQTGNGGTWMYLRGVANTTTNQGLVRIELDNTQSGATTLLDLRSGTSAQAHIGISMNMSAGSSSAIAYKGIAGTGTVYTASASGDNSIWFTGDSTRSSATLTGQTNDKFKLAMSRTLTGAIPITDNFNMGSFIRTTVVNNAGAAYTNIGSVLYLENVLTPTAGTVNSGVPCLSLVQDNDDKGGHIQFSLYTNTANMNNNCFASDGTNLYFRQNGGTLKTIAFI